MRLGGTVGAERRAARSDETWYRSCRLESAGTSWPDNGASLFAPGRRLRDRSRHVRTAPTLKRPPITAVFRGIRRSLTRWPTQRNKFTQNNRLFIPTAEQSSNPTRAAAGTIKAIRSAAVLARRAQCPTGGFRRLQRRTAPSRFNSRPSPSRPFFRPAS